MSEITRGFSSETPDDRLLGVNEALVKLSLIHPRKAELVKLR